MEQTLLRLLRGTNFVLLWNKFKIFFSSKAGQFLKLFPSARLLASGDMAVAV